MPRFFRHISASALQFGLNQALGVVMFYVLSRGLDRDLFGELNWALAVSLTAFTLLGAGLDALVVKRIAAGEAAAPLLRLYHWHVGWVGAAAYALLFIASMEFPAFFHEHLFLLGIALAKTLLFQALPYKQLAAGKEKFGILMKMSVGSALAKTAAFLCCWFTRQWDVRLVMGIFIVSDLAEWLISRYEGKKLLERKPVRSVQNYLSLLKTALPQAGTVLFSSALARFDWIFIGLFVSAAKLAEYSFAYKAYEVCSLPLLAIAPLLVPAFARGAAIDRNRLIRLELSLAWATVLCLNLLWTPVVDPLTGGMYGAVNAKTIFLLSLALPILYQNNFLWTLHFAEGRLRWILVTFACSFAVNVLGDVLLIPRWGNEGAAAAFLAAIVLQTLMYQKDILENGWWTQAICALSAAGAALATAGIANVWLRLFIAGASYIIGLILTRRLRRDDLVYMSSHPQPPASVSRIQYRDDR